MMNLYRIAIDPTVDLEERYAVLKLMQHKRKTEPAKRRAINRNRRRGDGSA